MGFGLYRLKPGDQVAEHTAETEVILVLVEGKAVPQSVAGTYDVIVSEILGTTITSEDAAKYVSMYMRSVRTHRSGKTKPPARA